MIEFILIWIFMGFISWFGSVLYELWDFRKDYPEIKPLIVLKGFIIFIIFWPWVLPFNIYQILKK